MNHTPTIKKLWLIIVPHRYKKIPFDEWCKKVCLISNGITVPDNAHGWWHNAIGNMHIEYNRLVQIACTEDEIEKIADITAEHYQQKAVMYYKISDFVKIKEYDK